jgi:uncharacterized protein (TIGR02145 family)
MKGIYLIFILSIICQSHLFSQVVVKRNNQVSKEAANVNWSKEFTLFDYTTDEPIFPLIRNGQAVYKIFYASKDDLRPNYGEFSVTQVEGLKYYKFKNRETCLKFCMANKLNAVPTLTTASISALTTSSATSGGNITADGGASITARGVVWSTSTNPTIAISTKTSNGNGTGTFTSTLTNLTPKTTYFVRAYATNSSGAGYGNEISFTTSDSTIVMGIPCPGTPTVKDIDGNTYNTVQIGTQCWTKENLRVTKYRDGSVIPLDESGGTSGNGTGQTWSSRTTGARTVYAHSVANLSTYGYLYNWYAVADSKGLCPSGWHVPSDSEWTTLTTYLGGESVAGGKMKSTGTTLWNSPNTGATNESSFSAFPGGFRNRDGSFGYEILIHYGAFFWSSTEYYSGALNRNLYSYRSSVNGIDNFFNGDKLLGASIRCLKDTNSIVSIPTLNTSAISAITTTSATSGGNITSDGRASITARGVVWSTNTNPTISLSTKTTDGTGSGSFSSTLTNLTPKTTYYVRAYASNSAGTGYGNEISFTTLDSSKVMNIPCPGTPTVKDIDGNTYNTVQIGTQCWTKENLRVTKYSDGSIIPLDESGGTNGDGTGQTWSSRTSGARTVNGHNTANLETYGYLYNWYSVADSKGLCPNGWHVPSEADWKSLGEYLGTNAGVKLADTSWLLATGKPTNESGFSIIPGGYRGVWDTSGRFGTPLTSGNFWSTSNDNNFTAKPYIGTELYFKGNWNWLNYYGKTGLSVRCIKLPDSIISIPNVSTISISSISSNSVISGGTIYSDGGSSVTSRGVVWANNPAPTIALSTKTADYFGTGTYKSSIINLKPNTTYYLRAYATNNIGTTYGNELIFNTQDSIMNIPCPGYSTVKDIDGNTYNTVKIGSQCWTKENLRVTKYRDGTVIPLDDSGGTTGNGIGQAWSSKITGARTIYEHNDSKLATYGYLYNWYAATDTKGLCPSGWHVPSADEFKNLTAFLGGVQIAGALMKSIDTTLWKIPNSQANNKSGFSALPGGFRNNVFTNISSSVGFWSTTNVYDYSAIVISLISNGADLFSYGTGKWSGYSIRCLKDTSSTVSIPTITTTGISLITTTSATSGGNITSDGGAPITARGVVWSTSTNPNIALTTKTSDGTGTGSFSSILINLTSKTTYYLRAYATNSAGTGYGNEITFTTLDSSNVMGIPCPGAPTVKDIDGNTYNTVQIGTQCWTKENLRVTKYRDGTDVPLDESGGTSGNGTGQTWGNRNTGARTVYGHIAANLATYGYLYNWYAAVDSKGLCPSGWHIPLDEEWTILIKFLDNNANNGIASTFQSFTAGGTLKELGTTYWEDPNKGATNESGFSALPSGNRYSDGEFGRIGNIKSYCFFWSATVSTNLFYALGRDLYSTNSYIGMNANVKSVGGPVRCLKDTFSIVSAPTLTTTAITSITTTSSTSGGNITSVGGAPITARGVVWSTTTNPTIALSTKTSDGTGTGSFTSTLNNLTPKTTYYVRAFATNSDGTGYGNEITFITSDSSNVMGIPCPGTPTVKDIDGNNYNTVQIGTQCWTKENLRVTKYRDGTVIPLDESGGTVGNGTGEAWSSRTIGARTVYGHSDANLATYGYLYNWYAVNDIKGLCPSGWHVPNNSEWKTLITYLGGDGVAGGKMKSAGTTFWNSPNLGATNESFFGALPSGVRTKDIGFWNIRNTALFWSVSEYGSTGAWCVPLVNYSSYSILGINLSTLGASIRCLKD